jgi:hypothetical protein
MCLIAWHWQPASPTPLLLLAKNHKLSEPALGNSACSHFYCRVFLRISGKANGITEMPSLMSEAV